MTAVQHLKEKWYSGKLILEEDFEKAIEMEMNQLEQFYNHAMWALVDGNGHGECFIDYYERNFK